VARRHDLASDQAGGWQIRDTDRHVEPLLYDIKLLIAERHLDLELELTLNEFGDRATKVERPEETGALTRNWPRGLA
jgi:hypothetical protein